MRDKRAILSKLADTECKIREMLAGESRVENPTADRIVVDPPAMVVARDFMIEESSVRRQRDKTGGTFLHIDCTTVIRNVTAADNRVAR